MTQLLDDFTTYVCSGYTLTILSDSIRALESQGYQMIGNYLMGDRPEGDKYPYGNKVFYQVMWKCEQSCEEMEW